LSRRKPRHLRPEEEELWHRVARTAQPIEVKKSFRKIASTNVTSASENKRAQDAEFQIEPFEMGSRSSASFPARDYGPIRPSKPDHPVVMDQKKFQKLKRGKTRPEARIDLHGMTADAACSALTGFLLRAQASGKRLVLVITGKGRPGDDYGPIPTRSGVLRRSLPDWVSRPPLSAVVLQTTEAHDRHGGSGAFYVYLRRSR
jgi:DNA-nicking Smr family endonuclease